MRVQILAFGQVVARHEGQRLRPQNAHLIERAAVAQHLGEAQIVARRGNKPSAAREKSGLHAIAACVGVIDQRHSTVFTALIARGKSVPLFRRHKERRIPHIERRENSLAQEFVQRLAAQDLDEVAENIGRDRIIPVLARREIERQFGQNVDPFAERSVEALELPLPIGGIHRRAPLKAIGEARHVREKIPHRHRPRRSRGFEASETPAYEYAEIGECGNVFRHRIVELEASLLEERHESDAHNRLGHGVNADERLGRKRPPALAILEALCREMGDAAAARDRKQHARKRSAFDVACKVPVDARELAGVEADIVGLGGWKLGHARDHRDERDHDSGRPRLCHETR